MLMDSSANSWLGANIPGKVWHYTSLSGFHGIMSTRVIHVTDIRYLNDVKEFVHTRDIILQAYADGGKLGKEVTDFLWQFISDSRLQIFVASFSTAEDQLSQWRGYSRGSSGISLGFDLSHIREIPDDGKFVAFAQCVYEDAKKKLMIDDAVSSLHQEILKLEGEANDLETQESLLREMQELYPEWGPKRARNELQTTTDEWLTAQKRRSFVEAKIRLVQLAALFKHSSFAEEKEWRLIIAAYNDSDPRFYRAGATTLIPYLKVAFSAQPETPIPLVDVILGPGSEQPIGRQAAEGFLKSQGITIDPRQSAIPFRPW